MAVNAEEEENIGKCKQIGEFVRKERFEISRKIIKRYMKHGIFEIIDSMRQNPPRYYTAGNPRFHDIYYDGESHYYIDGTVLKSAIFRL